MIFRLVKIMCVRVCVCVYVYMDVEFICLEDLLNWAYAMLGI